MQPVLFSVSEFNVYAFGLFLALSFVISTFIVWKFSRDHFNEEEYLDAFLATSIAALLTGRVVYIILHFSQFQYNILAYILVRETPGLSLIGGLLGGLFYLFWYAKRKRIQFLPLLDLFSVASCFALFLAKIGEQLGGASFGKKTDLLWGVRIIGAEDPRHPVEFYEALGFFLLFIILLLVYKRVRKGIIKKGWVSYAFAVGAFLILFLLEFFKEYQVYWYQMSLRQYSAFILLFACSVVAFYKSHDFSTKRPKKTA